MKVAGTAGVVLAVVILTSCDAPRHARREPPRPVPPVRVAARVQLVEGRPTQPRYVLPVPATTVEPRGLAAPHHDYPAADLMVPAGTPVFAPHGGRVVVHGGRRCGHGVTVLGADGFRYVSCHLARVAVVDASAVAAGDVLGLSGDTGNARGVPHLHFHIRDRAGRYVCPQGVLLEWYHGREASPGSTPWPRSCTFPRDGPAR